MATASSGIPLVNIGEGKYYSLFISVNDDFLRLRFVGTIVVVSFVLHIYTYTYIHDDVYVCK